jgi:hypothetical protein
MGRYASFSTGLEYKFWFGIQESYDIKKFYGEFDEYSYDEYTGQYHISWKATLDKERIQKKLEQMREKFAGLPVIQFDSFDASIYGTYELRTYITESVKGVDEKVHCKYVLGCLIYHQLLYENDLECDFEI